MSTSIHVLRLRKREEFRRKFRALEGKILLLERDIESLEQMHNPNWNLQPRAPQGVPEGGRWIDAGFSPQALIVLVGASVRQIAKVIEKLRRPFRKMLSFWPLPLPANTPPYLEEWHFFRLEPSLRRPYMSYFEFDSYPEFFLVFGSAGPGYQWHHIVEQRMATQAVDRLVFPVRSIQNTDNIVRVTVAQHACVNKKYSVRNLLPDGTWRTLRQYLNRRPWPEHFTVGLRVLKECKHGR